jgi:hypothetical protein
MKSGGHDGSNRHDYFQGVIVPDLPQRSPESGGAPRMLLDENEDLSFRGPATLHPDDHSTGCRAEESAVGSREAGRGSPAPSPRRRNSQTGPV